jgi:DNA processing protein
VGWSDIGQEVLFTGSARAVLDRLRGAEAALFPDPALDEAARLADAELGAWEAAGLDLVTVLSDRYPQRLASVFDCPPFLFARGAVDPQDRGMSVVGSRRASAEGLEVARRAAGLLVERELLRTEHFCGWDLWSSDEDCPEVGSAKQTRHDGILN